MNDEANIQIAQALRDRFESDAILGARVLPVRPPKRTAQSWQHAPAAVSTPRPELPAAPAGPLSNAGHGIQTQISADERKERRIQLDVMDAKEVNACVKCGLHSTRNKTVFGVGSEVARIMFVGEGPGADEDASGIPFVGRAGELLTKMIESGMGLKRDEVYICNVVKCRPPNNRTPAPDEIMMCKDYLLRQIDIIRPEVIIALGGPAAQTLLNTRDGITRIRGKWHEFYPSGTATIGESIPLMPTFHPAYLLRSPNEKAKAWSDLKAVMAKLGLAIPAR